MKEKEKIKQFLTQVMWAVICFASVIALGAVLSVIALWLGFEIGIEGY